VTQHQRQATEQVMASMDEMNEVLRQTVAGVKHTNDTARSLVDLSTTLSAIVDPRRERVSTGVESGA
jgi:methyl-accepting chemotaxis protein